jgi:ketosteroid isomerase-like protein
MPAATSQEKVRQPQVSQGEADILAVLETLRKANHRKDAVNLEEKRAWFDSWETPVDLEARDFNVTVSGDFAFCHGFLHMSGTKKGADRQASFWMRETLCLERKSGAWQIVHEHTSVPFYMDAGTRPAFDLQP